MKCSKNSLESVSPESSVFFLCNLSS